MDEELREEIENDFRLAEKTLAGLAFKLSNLWKQRGDSRLQTTSLKVRRLQRELGNIRIEHSASFPE